MARTLALAANDARLFAQIVDQTAVEFEIDGLTVKVDGLCILFDRQLAPEPRRNLVRTSVMFVNRLAAAERYDEAVKLAKLSFAAARELGDERIVAYLASRGKELVASQARSVAAKAALAVLAERPNDPTANEQAGLWFWLDKLDRDRGFAYLAKAEDEQLRTAVVAALANPAAPPAQLTLADTWFDLGKGLTTGAKRAAILRESLQWYRRALVHLPAATTAYKRVVALEREVGSRTVPPLVVDLDQATSKLPLDQDDEGATTVQLEILRIDGFAPPPRLPTGAQRLTFSIPVRLVLHETDPRIEIQFVLKSVNGQRLLAVSPVFVETAGSLLPFTNQRISALKRTVAQRCRGSSRSNCRLGQADSGFESCRRESCEGGSDGTVRRLRKNNPPATDATRLESTRRTGGEPGQVARPTRTAAGHVAGARGPETWHSQSNIDRLPSVNSDKKRREDGVAGN